MIAKPILEAVLAKAMSTGADFAEVYVDRTKENNIMMIASQIDRIKDSLLSGVGIRVFKGLRCVNASTADLSLEGMLACAGRVADVLGEGNEEVSIHLTERLFGDIHPIRVVPDTVFKAQKADILKEAYFAAKEKSDRISQVSATLLDVDHQILVANSDGLFAQDRQIRTRLAVEAVASKNGENQTGSCSPGRRMGIELFEIIQPSSLG